MKTKLNNINTMIDPATWSQARRALEKAIVLYLTDPGVALIDLGFRLPDSGENFFDPELVVRIHMNDLTDNDDFDMTHLESYRWIHQEQIGFPVAIVKTSYCFSEHFDIRTELTRNEKMTPDRTVIPCLGMQVVNSGGGSGVISGVLGYSMRHANGTDRVIGPIIHIITVEPGRIRCVPADVGVYWCEQQNLRAAGLHLAASNDLNFSLALSMPDLLQFMDNPMAVNRGNPHVMTSGIKKLSATGTGATAAIPPSGSKLITANDTTATGFTSSAKHRATAQQKLPAHYQKATGGQDGILRRSSFADNIKRFRYFRGTLEVWLLVLSLVMILKCGYDLPVMLRQKKAKIDLLQPKLFNLRSTIQIDDSRRQSLDKIISIMDTYNSASANDMKIKIAAAIYQASLRYENLDIELLCATITHETSRTWNTKIVSPAGAIGLMQIMPATGAYLAQRQGIAYQNIEDILFDPVLNIRLGSCYLSELIELYHLDGGLAAYNGGANRARQWLQNGRTEGILHEETAFYVPSILRIYWEFKRM